MKLLQIIVWLSAVALLAGLYKPWWVLWWMARQNRKKVLSIYGTAFAVSLAIYLGLHFY